MLTAIVLTAPTFSLEAQGPAAQPAAPRLDATVRRAVVDTIASQLVRLYVDADTGRLIADHLRRRLASGAYERLVEPGLFAEALTADLRSINNDGHLSVGYDPGARAMRPGPGGIPTPRPVRRVSGGAGGGGGGGQAPPGALTQARRSNYGFGRIDILPGNVGYIEVRGFNGGPEGFDVATAALRYVERSDALIFDLRRMPGGSGALSNFVISHFTGPDSVLSLRITNRSAGESVDRYTLDSVPGPRRLDVPVYVLTSRGTASAGEDFAFVLKNLGRATVVGDRTAGAGHNNAFVESGHGFVTSISFTRVTDPKTGKEWERVGVQPDIPTSPEDALTTAHVHALKRLAEAEADPVRKRALTLNAEALAARPVAVPQATLARYAGEYEGGRLVTLKDGQLYFQPGPNFPPDQMVPLSENVFSILLTMRASFVDGAIRMSYADGTSRTFPRVK